MEHHLNQNKDSFSLLSFSAAILLGGAWRSVLRYYSSFLRGRHPGKRSNDRLRLSSRGNNRRVCASFILLGGGGALFAIGEGFVDDC